MVDGYNLFLQAFSMSIGFNSVPFGTYNSYAERMRIDFSLDLAVIQVLLIEVLINIYYISGSLLSVRSVLF